MTELVFATNNTHKLHEVKDIAGSRINILSLHDIGCYDDIPENADTLEGNASIKSWYIFNKFGRDCFADDTGLEVEALGGLPGVKSARYAGDDCIAENNVRKLLRELHGVENRKARFRTVISLIINGKEMFFEGSIDGVILNSPRGKEGFGYDPVFLPNGYQNSFAEMDLNLKNTISHRGKAFRKLIGHLLHSTPLR